MQRKMVKPIKLKKKTFICLKKKDQIVVMPQIFNNGFMPRN